MAEHVNHHFVPKLLLRQWHSGRDNKLTTMRWVRDRIRTDRHKAKSVASVANLYSIEWPWANATERDTSVETKFFAESIEMPAARVLPKLLDQNIYGLTSDERWSWAKFLVSQTIRVPQGLAAAAAKAKELHRSDENFIPEIAHRETDGLEWLYRNLALQSLEVIVNGPLLAPTIYEAHWGVRHIKHEFGNLLIGDTPVVLDGGLGGNFSLAMPISPQHIFVASRDPATFRELFEQPARDSVDTFNIWTVEAAQMAVFGVDDTNSPLVECHLRHPSPSLPLYEATCAATTRP